MRSSKQRSRNKPNRNRSVGNVVNRVFDSSGPEGKVRGTPQQIIDKYNQLARDSQLSGDRVATENFQQHAEHYTRMLAEAMREQEARREAQEAQNRERQQQRNAERDNRDMGGQPQPQSQSQPQSQPQPQSEASSQPDVAQSAPEAVSQPAPQPEIIADQGTGDQPDVIDMDRADDAGLVETPESKPKPKPRRPRKKPAKPEPDPAEAAE